MRICYFILKSMKLHLSEQKKILFIKTSVWNSIKNIFQVKKDLDISKYLISIKILENKVIIRTNKPIFNSEAILLEDDIKWEINQKLKKAEIDFEFDLIYK